MKWRANAILAVVIALMSNTALISSSAVLAQTAPCDAPQGPPQYPDAFSWYGGNYLLGDLNGLRTKAQASGINICAQYNASAYNNFAGGLRTGPVAQGQFFGWLDLDLAKFTWSSALDGTYFHAAMYSMQGESITARNVGALSAVTFIEQLPTTRLGAVWLERQFAGGKLSLRAGQLGIDDEFIIAPTAVAFINSTFGFPSWASTDLPGGGAAYPLQGPGARLKYAASDAVTLMAGIYTGDPAGQSNPIPQLANRYGTTFNLRGGAFYIGEAAYSTAYANSGVDLPGTYKIGGWYENGNRFADQRFDTLGFSLANPLSSSLARNFNSDWGLYAVVDQTILAGEKDGLHKLSGFVRPGFSPSDRNLVDFYVDAGLTFTGPLPGRPTDVVGIAGAFDHISPDASALDRDRGVLLAPPGSYPVRDHEIMLEAIYTINVTKWLAIDLDVQHFFHPGGNVLAAIGPNKGRLVKDATLFGLNTQIKF
jgi:porin